MSLERRALAALLRSVMDKLEEGAGRLYEINEVGRAQCCEHAIDLIAEAENELYVVSNSNAALSKRSGGGGPRVTGPTE